jgi:hypothetical protein
LEVPHGYHPGINISSSDDMAGKLLEATSRLTHEALHDINVQFSGTKHTIVDVAVENSLGGARQPLPPGCFPFIGKVVSIFQGAFLAHR